MNIPRILSCSSCCGTGPRILGMLAMTASFMLVELIVGHLTNSMALVADSFHMLSDVIALIIAYISVRFVITSSINADIFSSHFVDILECLRKSG